MDELWSLIKLQSIKSCVKWGTTTSRLILFIINGLLFSIFLAFLSFVTHRLQLAAEFAVVVVGILNSKHSWISPCPLYMYILLNLVIVSLAVKSGILRPTSPMIKVDSEEDSVGKLELKVQNPANEIQRTIRIRCSKLQDFKSLPNTLFSQKPTSKGRNGNNNRRSSLEQCAAARRLFFVEVSDGPREADHCMNMDMESEQGCDDAGLMCADELNVKAEKFIRNFYRQLKMQREDYGKRIYGVVQKESH